MNVLQTILRIKEIEELANGLENVTSSENFDEWNELTIVAAKVLAAFGPVVVDDGKTRSVVAYNNAGGIVEKDLDQPFPLYQEVILRDNKVFVKLPTGLEVQV